MSEIIRFSSGGPWETKVGYSRVVKAGPLISISGCTSFKDAAIVHPSNPALQMQQAINNLKAALELVGASKSDLIRTRIYIVNQEDWQAITEVHAAEFAENPPACTLVIIKELIDPQMLVEIKGDAWNS